MPQNNVKSFPFSPPSMSSLTSLIDLAIYSLDISMTMSSLVSVFPPASTPLHQTGLEVKLAMFYTSVITPPLITQVPARSHGSP